MSRKWVWFGIGALVLYTAGLLAALLGADTTVAIAVIAVGGTAVGAATGLAGSVVVASTQAQSNLEMKKIESANAHSQLLAQEALRWTDKAYSDLGEFLRQSRKLGTTFGNFDSYDDVIVEFQAIDTLKDLLISNPLVRPDQQLVHGLRQYMSDFVASAPGNWEHAHGGPWPPVTGVPIGMQGNRLAELLGDRLAEVTKSVGLFAPDSAQISGHST